MINQLSHLNSDGIDSSTPVKLVEEVVDKLNIDWYNPHLKILDVKSNKATFSLIIIEKLLNHGHHIDHILDNMIYAIDGDKIQSLTSNKAFLKIFKRSGNIYHDDFLTYDFKMKFDLIVGNPPYQKEANIITDKNKRAGGLWWSFIKRSEEVLSDGGYLAIVCPNSLFGAGHIGTDNSKILQFLKSMRFTHLWPNVNNYFSVGINILTFVAKKTTHEIETFIENDDPVIITDDYPIPYHFTSKSYSIVKKNDEY
jgi:type I restriction-modification system DNA methylase subunit